jgi:diguanylate cyclase (GGDEF)-like protein
VSPDSISSASPPVANRLVIARRDVIVLIVLISAVMLLIWNGSAFFNRLSLARGIDGPGVKIAWMALTLNVALILFGWRRYVDLQQETAHRLEGERRARTLASTDGITGLANRKGYADGGERLCETLGDGNRHMVVLSLQLHRFKTINDRHGYEVGDAVLRRIAGQLRDAAPPSAVVARLAGDEFALAFSLPGEAIDSAGAMAAELLRQVTRPIEEQGKLIEVGAFVGIAAAPAAGLHLPDLSRRAEIAMNHAASGRAARPVWFDTGMERALVAHGELEQAIRYGLEHDHFIPLFEPQVDLVSGRIVGFEMLARLHHPLGGLLGADLIIPAAEEMGVIGRLSDQLMRKAFTAASGWSSEVHLSVNVSPLQLSDGWLAHRILQLLAGTGFPARRLIVEITESSLFADLDLARTIVTSLKNQGIRIALDDFGSGFSSLSNLRALPFDMIKIDRSFVASLSNSRESEVIIRAVTALAQGLEVPVTAEGIEDEATYEALVGMGCAAGQGWYFGKPMHADAASQMIQDRGAKGSIPIALAG